MDLSHGRKKNNLYSTFVIEKSLRSPKHDRTLVRIKMVVSKISIVLMLQWLILVWKKKKKK